METIDFVLELYYLDNSIHVFLDVPLNFQTSWILEIVYLHKIPRCAHLAFIK